MRRLVIGLGVLCTLGAFSAVSAQSLFDRCQKKKADIAVMEDSVGTIDGDVNKINSRLENLRRKQKELLQQKTAKAREKAALLRRIKSEKAHHARMCVGLRQCEKLERKIEKLKKRIAPLSDRLRRIREEIRSRREESNRLSEIVEKIEASYANLKCDDLVAGQAAQATIDRCSDLFSRWNKLQADINKLQSSVVALRDRYKRVMKKMRAQNAELVRLAKKMRKACSHSSRMAELETLEKEQHGYRAISDDLEKMSRRVKKFRALKIRRPKMKPTIRRKKGKPTISPKKKKGKHTIKPKKR